MRLHVLTIAIGFAAGGGDWARAGAPAQPAGGADQPAAAQPSAQQPAAAQPASADAPAFKQEELDQMLAPIAIYPDSLLSQVLMASTYPLEIVKADRWAKAHKNLQGDAAAKALEAEPWDPSVKSLVNFPDVLSLLSDKMDRTQKLGDAFLDQQKEVMDTVQKLRAKAKEAGNLESNQQQKVEVKREGSTQVIVIESADPDVIYVPSPNTTVVYGGWPYPAYPPYPYYPPHYPLGGFGLGVACGVAWGYAWGHCDWGHGDVNIDCDRNVNRNTNIDRDKAKRDMANRGAGQGGRGNWQHDGAHRGNAPYRNQSDARKYGGNSSRQAAQSREAYRGRAEAGRRDIAAGGADQFKGRDSGAANRAGSAGGSRPTSSSRGRDSALGGVDRGGSAARASSSRGNSSLSSGSRSSGSRSGGSRGGGGGRGGGGRGGGGRR